MINHPFLVTTVSEPPKKIIFGCVQKWLKHPFFAGIFSSLALGTNTQHESPISGKKHHWLSHRIGSWEIFSRNPLYLMIKNMFETMVSGEDFPSKTNPVVKSPLLVRSACGSRGYLWKKRWHQGTRVSRVGLMRHVTKFTASALLNNGGRAVMAESLQNSFFKVTQKTTM